MVIFVFRQPERFISTQSQSPCGRSIAILRRERRLDFCDTKHGQGAGKRVSTWAWRWLMRLLVERVLQNGDK